LINSTFIPNLKDFKPDLENVAPRSILQKITNFKEVSNDQQIKINHLLLNAFNEDDYKATLPPSLNELQISYAKQEVLCFKELPKDMQSKQMRNSILIQAFNNHGKNELKNIDVTSETIKIGAFHATPLNFNENKSEDDFELKNIMKNKNIKETKSGKAIKQTQNVPLITNINSSLPNFSDIGFNKLNKTLLDFKPLEKDTLLRNEVIANNENPFRQIKSQFSLNIFKRYANEFINFAKEKRGTIILLKEKLKSVQELLRKNCKGSKYDKLFTQIHKVKPLNTLDECLSDIIETQQNLPIQYNNHSSSLENDVSGGLVAKTLSLLNLTPDSNTVNPNDINILEFKYMKLSSILENYLALIRDNITKREAVEIKKYFSPCVDDLGRTFMTLKQNANEENIKLYFKQVKIPLIF
jgi:hypothetical protein